MRHSDIPTDLTFEQFKALAMREPDLEGDWVYELRMTEYDPDEELPYPQFELGVTTRYLFPRLEDAEGYMRERLTGPSVYCFHITQLPLGADISRHGAQWLYDNAGTLLDRKVTHWDESLESIYFGPAREPRFHRGDIVEVRGRDNKVNLAVVVSEPLPIEWFWEKYQKLRGDYYFDASDDAYYLLEGPGYMHHTHVSDLSLMAPRRPIPDDIRRYFGHCLECADEEDCTKVYHAAYFSDTEPGKLGEDEIGLLYDEATGRHRLSYTIYDFAKDSNDRRVILPGTLDEARLAEVWCFLSQVMYGKTRLWYLIRDWNEYYRDADRQPHLSPDTTINQLLS